MPTRTPIRFEIPSTAIPVQPWLVEVRTHTNAVSPSVAYDSRVAIKIDNSLGGAQPIAVDGACT